jgi:hypothetical protein
MPTGVTPTPWADTASPAAKRKAIALDPKNTYVGWGNARLALKRVEEANGKYRIAKELENNDRD